MAGDLLAVDEDGRVVVHAPEVQGGVRGADGRRERRLEPGEAGLMAEGVVPDGVVLPPGRAASGGPGLASSAIAAFRTRQPVSAVPVPPCEGAGPVRPLGSFMSIAPE